MKIKRDIVFEKYNMERYCVNVCNYLNNLKGYIEKEEVVNLLWCVFGVESDTFNEDLITDKFIYDLSCYVACDNGTNFYKTLCELYEVVKEDIERESE